MPQAENIIETARLMRFSDDRGQLTVAQDEIPFDVKRVYWIEAKKSSVRGCHRHVVTRQAFIVMSGAVMFHLQNMEKEWSIKFSDQQDLLILEPQVWHKLEFLQDSLVLALASHDFDISDYIYEPYFFTT